MAKRNLDTAQSSSEDGQQTDSKGGVVGGIEAFAGIMPCVGLCCMQSAGTRREASAVGKGVHGGGKFVISEVVVDCVVSCG